MTDRLGDKSTAEIIDRLDDFDNQISASANYLKGVKSSVSKARKSLRSQIAPGRAVTVLISELERLEAKRTAEPSLSDLRKQLAEYVLAIRQRFAGAFATELKKASDAASLTFKPLNDDYGIGPFKVTIDIPHEAASIEYAKTPLLSDIRLNVDVFVEEVARLKAEIVDAFVDLPGFQTQLEEAMLVASIRQRKIPKGDVRIDLPSIFHELEIIRQRSVSGAKRNAAAYSTARFVVELKTLVQSNLNLKSDNQFRLETAVIENTKNPRKSLFIPKDIACGYGEGTYYQAVLRKITL